MGAKKSKPLPPDDACGHDSEFDKPWRTMPWGKQGELEQKLRDFKLNHPDVQFVRILLVGYVAAGKSSFINSVNNVFQKRITSGALANTKGGKSFTKTYQTHYIKGKDGSRLPFTFNDVMGLEKDEAGAQSQDMIRALSGFLKEGHNFENASSGSVNRPDYRNEPSPEDQTYCLVYVIAADVVSLIPQEVIDKMILIREAAARLNMPQVIIMTKPDSACQLVSKDLRKIYTSKKIKQKMEVCSNLVGVPVNHIFPVKNYYEESDTDNDMDLLILKALDQIVNVACDALNNKSSRFDGTSE